MTLTRRDLTMAGMGALAVGAAAALVGPAAAIAADEAGGAGAVGEAVEALRKALLAQDKAKLEGLAAEQLSYGHSSGVVQNKAEFVNGVMTRKGTVKSLEFPELKIALAGDAAIARHLYVAAGETDGKPTDIKIGVLGVWQRQDGIWKLLARQGYKLA